MTEKETYVFGKKRQQKVIIKATSELEARGKAQKHLAGAVPSYVGELSELTNENGIAALK